MARARGANISRAARASRQGSARARTMQSAALLRPTGASAYYRAQRLNPKQPNVCWAYATDLGIGVAVPALMGVAIAAVCVSIVENVDDAPHYIREHLHSDHVVASLGTMLAFLVSLRLGANLARNSGVIGQFGNLCGACVNLAIWTRSLVSSGKIELLSLPDADGGTYRTTEIGLVLASIPYIVKYQYRGTKLKLEQLPLGASPGLLARARALVNPPKVTAQVPPFLAAVVLLGQFFDDLEHAGQIKGPELGLVFNQLSALTNAEGAIGGIDGYGQPGVLTVLMYLLFVSYFVLLTLGDVAINNGWQGLWIVPVLVVANLGLFQVSRRYQNPFDIRRAKSTQKPLITDASIGTEKAIDAVFSRRRPNAIAGPAEAAAKRLAPANEFSLGLMGRA